MFCNKKTNYQASSIHDIIKIKAVLPEDQYQNINKAI